MRQNSGQILLVVVLSMVVALTVGLSVASRTISNLKISKQNEESQRAFNAAEAGLDVALKKIQGGTCSGSCSLVSTDLVSNGAKYSYDVSPDQANAGGLVLNGGDSVNQGLGVDLWLTNYNNFGDGLATYDYDGQITIYWGDTSQTNCVGGSGSSVKPALEVTALYSSTANWANPSLYREIYDPCSGRVTYPAAATAGSYNIDYRGQRVNFQYSATFPTGTTTLGNIYVVKITPIYNSTHVGVKPVGSETFPPQGSIITSTGKSGDTVRKIQYFQSYSQIPDELFHYAILSQ